MALRTYFWETPKVSLFQQIKNKLRGRVNQGFRFGNAGDIFNKDLISYLYQEDCYNTRTETNKLLLVGSIASVIRNNDVICGIGWKGNDLESIKKLVKTTTVYGVRGPLTKQLFEGYNADLTKLKFMLDPGLLVKEVYNLVPSNQNKKDIIFIPHYKDELVYKKRFPKFVKHVCIDNHPKEVAKRIMNSKLVYTSSLHGIIFSHALNVPCVFVKPQSEEPMFKYKDYFMSVNIDMPLPLASINDANLDKDITTSLKEPITIKDFYFPSKEELTKKGIIF